MLKYIAQLRQQSIRSANGINERTCGWLWILASAAKEALKTDTAITAAAIAYFAFFSLFPITLLSISIASFSLARQWTGNSSFKGWSLLRRPWASCWAKILMKLSKRADQLPASLWLV